MNRRSYLYARACGLSRTAATRLAERPEAFEAARALREELQDPPLRVIQGGKSMGANAKRDVALSSTLQSAMEFLDSEGHISVPELVERARVDFIQASDSLVEAGTTYGRAMDLWATPGADGGPEVAVEAYKQLRQAIISSLVCLGHFPFYADVPDVAPGRTTQ